MSKNQIMEIGLLGLVGYMLFLNSTVINPTLAFIYTILLVISFAFVLGDGLYGKRQIPLINRSIPWTKSILIACIAYIILIATSYFTSSLAQLLPLKELLGLLGSSAPIFSNSSFFNFLNFGLLIPFIESFAIFCIAIDYFSSSFKINLNIISAKLVTLVIIICISFLFFHIQSKGIENEAALLLVFFMALISCILVLYYRESRTPIIFHCIANIVGILAFSSTSLPKIFSIVVPLFYNFILIVPH